MSLKTYLDAALASENGIELELLSDSIAVSLRRRFYSERNKLRKAGSFLYDGLSFIVENNCILIVKRNNKAVAPCVLKVTPIKANKVPSAVGARGASKLSIFTHFSALPIRREQP